MSGCCEHPRAVETPLRASVSGARHVGVSQRRRYRLHALRYDEVFAHRRKPVTVGIWMFLLTKRTAFASLCRVWVPN